MPATEGPVVLAETSHATLRPASWARVTAGFWHERRQVNARTSIPDGVNRLTEVGNLRNLRLAAGTGSGEYSGDFPFMDSDIHKWLEAAAWQLADGPSDSLAAHVNAIIGLLAEAAEPSGYLNSYYQVVATDRRFVELSEGHELYCAGHLIQAAVAHHRVTGRDDLLSIARRFADHIDEVLGPDGRVGVPGHPEIETALVELYRCTGERRYLTLATTFLDRRGHGLLGGGRFGAEYWQDHLPIRETRAVTGHAVRQLYLLAGVVDAYLETGEADLLDAAVRQWEDMVATKTYLTGGVGAHHRDEAFGDAYELPNERAYCETCAAIASIQLSWRLLLATGESRYADLMERTLYNGYLAGVSLSGDQFLYVNPLQVRDDHQTGSGDQRARRTRWFRCACCPPNIMRLLASLPHYLSATDDDGLRVIQYASGEYGGRCAAGVVGVRVTTGYPWQGAVRIEITRDEPETWRLTLRVPAWHVGAPRISVNGEPATAELADGWLSIARGWRVGDVVEVGFALPPRLTEADPRIDTTRGCLAIERGPLVYCLESVDQPADARLDDLLISAAETLRDDERPDLLGGVVAVRAAGHRRARPADGAWWPYQSAGQVASDTFHAQGVHPVELTAIPYYAWANREVGGMRVWIPSAAGARESDEGREAP